MGLFSLLILPLVHKVINTPAEYFEITGWTHLPATIKVWPLPQTISQIVDNFTLSLSPEFVIHTTSQSQILSDGVKRYHSIFQSISKNHTESKCGDGSVRKIEVVVDGDDEHLLLNTSYKYNVIVDVATGIDILAETPFGAL